MFQVSRFGVTVTVFCAKGDLRGFGCGTSTVTLFVVPPAAPFHPPFGVGVRIWTAQDLIRRTNRPNSTGWTEATTRTRWQIKTRA